MAGDARSQAPDGGSRPVPPAGVEALLAMARKDLNRLSPEQAAAAVADGAGLADGAALVDIRPVWQRAREGEVPGALVVERNHLEWRLDPTSEARLEPAVAGRRWIVICSEGYTSSLAAAALNSIGVPATDVIGGLRQWRAAGLPVIPGPTRVEQVCGAGPLLDLGDLGGPDVEDEATH